MQITSLVSLPLLKLGGNQTQPLQKKDGYPPLLVGAIFFGDCFCRSAVAARHRMTLKFSNNLALRDVWTLPKARRPPCPHRAVAARSFFSVLFRRKVLEREI